MIIEKDEELKAIIMSKRGTFMKLKTKLDSGAYLPTRAHETDAGLDLYAKDGAVLLPRMTRAMDEYGMLTGADIGVVFDTGVHIALKPGEYGMIAGRSGLNTKHSVVCPVGIIDSDFRGSIKVKLYNLGGEEYKVNKGDRIAQLIIEKCEYPELELVDELDETERADGGFGSTGV